MKGLLLFISGDFECDSNKRRAGKCMWNYEEQANTCLQCNLLGPLMVTLSSPVPAPLV